MAAPGDDGAAAAATYFISLYPYALATGDLTAWEDLAADSCEFCANIVQEIEQRETARIRRIGGDLEVISATGKSLGAEGWHSATVAVQIAASQDVYASGNEAGSNEPSHYTFGFALTWAEGWSVDSVGVVDDPTAG